MDEALLSQSIRLLNEVEQLGRFESKHHVSPLSAVQRVYSGLCELYSSIPERDALHTKDELYAFELKRRLMSAAFSLEQRLQPQSRDYNALLHVYGIPQEDITALRPWLLAHKEQVVQTIQNLYDQNGVTTYEIDVMGMPHLGSSLLASLEPYVTKYHSVLWDAFGSLPGSETPRPALFLGMIPRSYYDPLMNTVGIAVPNISYLTEDGQTIRKVGEVLRIFGHEGLGHARNSLLTKQSTQQLPLFLRKGMSLTTPTEESLAQHYERRIFEDLQGSQELLTALGIQDEFSRFYTDVKETMLLKQYQQRFAQYAITVLADSSFGTNPHDPQTKERRMQALQDVALNPGDFMSYVEQHLRYYDPRGNLLPHVVSELRYVAQPVSRALNEFKKHGILYEGESRALIDRTLLHGFWTPEGYVHHARLTAEEHAR